MRYVVCAVCGQRAGKSHERFINVLGPLFPDTVHAFDPAIPASRVRAVVETWKALKNIRERLASENPNRALVTAEDELEHTLREKLDALGDALPREGGEGGGE